MCGDPLRELVVKACETAAPIIHGQWREENANVPEHWMHYVVQPKQVFDAIGDGPTHYRMWDAVKHILGEEGYVVLGMLGLPGHYGPLCDDCRREKMDDSRFWRYSGRANRLTGPVNCAACGRRTPGKFRMYGHDEGVDIFEW